MGYLDDTEMMKLTIETCGERKFNPSSNIELYHVFLYENNDIIMIIGIGFLMITYIAYINNEMYGGGGGVIWLIYRTCEHLNSWR